MRAKRLDERAADLTRRANDKGVVIGIVAGFAANLLTWKWLPNISWLWWNVSGCAITMLTGYLTSFCFRPCRTESEVAPLVWNRCAAAQFGYQRRWGRYQLILVAYFFLIIGVLAFMGRLATGSTSLLH